MRLLLSALAFFSFAILKAQEIKHINFLDLPNADFKGKFSINKKARVQIDNINRFLYKVTVGKTDTDYNVAVPIALSGIKLPAFLSTQMPKGGGAPSPHPIASGSKTSTQLRSEIDNNLKELIKVQQYLNAVIDMHNKSVDLNKSCTKDFAAIQNDVITEMQSVLEAGNTTIINLSNQLQVDVFKNIGIAKTSYDNIEELLSQWEETRKKEYRTKATGDAEALVDLKAELAGLQAKLKASRPVDKPKIQYEIDAKGKDIRDLETAIKAAEEDYGLEKVDEKEKVEKAKTLWTEIDKFREEGKLYMLVNDFRKVNKSNYTYYSEIVKMKKDEVKFTFDITSNEPLTCDKPNEEKFEVTLRTQGGAKVDFSTGVFFNFGNEDFLGREYYYKKVNGTESAIIAADAGKRVLFSLGALMHVYKRSPAKVKLGGSVGASTTTSFDAFNFHLGPTLILGDNDRVCITAGLTLRETKLLDNRYKLDMNYTTEGLPEAIPTVKKFPVTGTFVALTYNFSKITK
jgi:hypothetical protein